MHLCRIVGLALAVILTLPASAAGQGRAATLARIKSLNQQAMDEYDGLEFEAAKKLLLEAVEVARSAALGQGRTLVRTYLNLGMVCGAGLNDRISAIKFFSEALRLDPAAALSPTRATPTLEEMFKSAQENVKSAPPPDEEAGFQHTPLDEVPRGRAVEVRARVEAEIPVARVLLFYRATGLSAFEMVTLREERRGSYVAVIPANRVTGSIHYYLEAQDEEGRRIRGSGSAASPNIIAVRGGGRHTPPPPRGKRKLFSVGVMIGLGVGIVYGGKSEHMQPQVGPEDFVPVGPGGALAPFHLAPELSYHLTENWHLSLLGRIQVVNALTTAGSISALGEVRAKWFFGTGPLRGFLGFGGGVGRVRHRIPLGDYDKNADLIDASGNPIPDPTPNDVVDSRVAGIGAFGLGSGLTYMFNPWVGIVAELNGLFLVPDFAANLDINTGLVFQF